MSALQKIKDKSSNDRSKLEWTVVIVSDGMPLGSELELAEQAASELAEMREALKKKNIILAMYANPDNWKSINGMMVLQTLCPPWADAKMALED